MHPVLNSSNSMNQSRSNASNSNFRWDSGMVNVGGAAGSIEGGGCWVEEDQVTPPTLLV